MKRKGVPLPQVGGGRMANGDARLQPTMPVDDLDALYAEYLRRKPPQEVTLSRRQVEGCYLWWCDDRPRYFAPSVAGEDFFADLTDGPFAPALLLEMRALRDVELAGQRIAGALLAELGDALPLQMPRDFPERLVADLGRAVVPGEILVGERACLRALEASRRPTASA